MVNRATKSDRAKPLVYGDAFILRAVEGDIPASRIGERGKLISGFRPSALGGSRLAKAELADGMQFFVSRKMIKREPKQ